MSQLRTLPPSQRWSLPNGRVMVRALRKDPTQEYLLYIPKSGIIGAPVLAAIHGISRNATQQAQVLAAHCEARNTILVVPIFDKDLHDDYQRLGREGRGMRSDLAMNRCIEEVAILTGADVSQVDLLGFSGGAQFVHRYLMAHPHRVRHAMVVAAGWYTFPNNTERYPYGIRQPRGLRGINFNPEEFLHVPVDVVVGAMDVGMDNVRQTKRTNKQQGTTRNERAHRWVDAMRSAAREYRVEPRVTLHEIPDVDHSFEALCASNAFRVVLDRMLTGRTEPAFGSQKRSENPEITQWGERNAG